MAVQNLQTSSSAPANNGGNAKGLGIASMVVGIVAILASYSVAGGLVLGAIGLGLGIFAKKSSPQGGNSFTIAGLVCSIIALVLSIVFLVIGYMAVSKIQNAVGGFMF